MSDPKVSAELEPASNFYSSEVLIIDSMRTNDSNLTTSKTNVEAQESYTAPMETSLANDVLDEDVEEMVADKSELIGDGSQPYALPTMKIKHERFKRIDAATLVKLIDGDYNHLIKSFTIVDCRYPYEYEGGHIQNAVNIHTGPELVKLFIDKSSQEHSQSTQQHHHHHPQSNHHHNHDNNNKPSPQVDDDDSMQPISSPSTSSSSSSPSPHSQPEPLVTQSQPIMTTSTNASNNSSSAANFDFSSFYQNQRGNQSNRSSSSSVQERHIIIFHCEFSSERGPRLMKLLREKDRQINKYPELMHPELYLLHGGYREFYKRFKQYCTPQAYKPMNCRNHREELRSYRKRRKVTNPRQRKENRTPDISFEG